MSDFKQRLVEERDQLKKRLEKLMTFLDGGRVESIDPKQVILLKVQRQSMASYLFCLEQRLELLNN